MRNLSKSGLAPRTRTAEERPWYRIVVEKPFGRSLESAMQLNDLMLGLFAEHQTYRIDHYLGKETVQNLLVLRFANSIFEPLWNRQWIEHVQITAAESVGVEERGKYYEEAGVLRDMFQNHLLQLLTLTAMEPPPQMSANAVRDEKVKVLQSIRALTPESIALHAVRAQYTAGVMNGKPVRGYTEENNVAPDSMVPTYAALRLYVDNWRWNGVPFYLRSGKRLKQRVSEIAVQFRAPPHLMFGSGGEGLRPNTLAHARAAQRGHLAQLRGQGSGRRGRPHVAHRDRSGRHEVQLRRSLWRSRGTGVRDTPARRHDRRGDAVHAQRRSGSGVACRRSAHRVLGVAQTQAYADLRRGKLGTARSGRADREGRDGMARSRRG